MNQRHYARLQRWDVLLLVSMTIFILGMAGLVIEAPSVVSADQGSSRTLTYRRIELVGSGVPSHGRGCAIIQSVLQDGQAVESFMVRGVDLPPDEEIWVVVNGRPLHQVPIRTDDQGRMEITFVRGQQLTEGELSLPSTTPSVVEFETVELLTRSQEVLLSGSYELIQDTTLSIDTIRILDATGEVALRGEFSPISEDGEVLLVADLISESDPDATGRAIIRFSELSAGGFDQTFELNVQKLDVNPPFVLELNQGEVTLFTTTITGRAELAYQGRFEAQATPLEATSALAQAEMRLDQADEAIQQARDLGVDVSTAQQELDQARDRFQAAEQSLATGAFSASIDIALAVADEAREAKLEAEDTADQAYMQDDGEDNNDNGDDGGVDNSNDNGNDDGGVDNSNDNGNDSGTGSGNDNSSDNGDNGNSDTENDNGESESEAPPPVRRRPCS
ncbi:MAG: hypothetical protein D6723_12335 [Acidobacteria bacterium]|nr:MAG: hypothetical protein D6723_12335 [Acidobacteriota bacterium]